MFYIAWERVQRVHRARQKKNKNKVLLLYLLLYVTLWVSRARLFKNNRFQSYALYLNFQSSVWPTYNIKVISSSQFISLFTQFLKAVAAAPSFHFLSTFFSIRALFEKLFRKDVRLTCVLYLWFLWAGIGPAACLPFSYLPLLISILIPRPCCCFSCFSVFSITFGLYWHSSFSNCHVSLLHFSFQDEQGHRNRRKGIRASQRNYRHEIRTRKRMIAKTRFFSILAIFSNYSSITTIQLWPFALVCLSDTH